MFEWDSVAVNQREAEEKLLWAAGEAKKLMPGLVKRREKIKKMLDRVELTIKRFDLIISTAELTNERIGSLNDGAS